MQQTGRGTADRQTESQPCVHTSPFAETALEITRDRLVLPIALGSQQNLPFIG